jgi:D-sedoheptulose 7-phosphate isomerase
MSSPDFDINEREVSQYFITLSAHLAQIAVTSVSAAPIRIADAINQIAVHALAAHAAGKKLIFIGNGGSAAIASHMATDYSKNGRVRSLALNDSSMLTCLGNDLGYDQIFAKQIEWHACAGDIVIAISSSGQSSNILNAVRAARVGNCMVLTLSGFTPANPLRSLGDINFYIGSDRYGFVEIGHLAICHAVLDFICGLRDNSVSLPGATAIS